MELSWNGADIKRVSNFKAFIWIPNYNEDKVSVDVDVVVGVGVGMGVSAPWLLTFWRVFLTPQASVFALLQWHLSAKDTLEECTIYTYIYVDKYGMYYMMSFQKKFPSCLSMCPVSKPCQVNKDFVSNVARR